MPFFIGNITETSPDFLESTGDMCISLMLVSDEWWLLMPVST